MRKRIEVSPQIISYSLLSVYLIPRFISSYAISDGTLYILLFIIAFTVLMPDLAEGYESKKLVNQFPKYSQISIIILSIILIFIISKRNLIYDKHSANFYTEIRRLLYFYSPLVYLIWYPYIHKNKKIYFLLMLLSMTILMGLGIVLPNILEGMNVIKPLSNATAKIVATFMMLIQYENGEVLGNRFGNKEFLIEVSDGCSSLKQIFVSIYAMVVFYICCRIKIKVNILKILIFSIMISIFTNAIRITILSITVSINCLGMFDFWHSGIGSLMFSLISMFLCCAIYYRYWSKENPV